MAAVHRALRMVAPRGDDVPPRAAPATAAADAFPAGERKSRPAVPAPAAEPVPSVAVAESLPKVPVPVTVRSLLAVPPPAADVVPSVAVAGSLPKVPLRSPGGVRAVAVPAPAAEVVPLVAVAGSLPSVPVPGTVRSGCGVCAPAPVVAEPVALPVGGPSSMVPVPGTVRSVEGVPTGAGVCALPGTFTLASAMPARSAESNLFINVPLESWTLLTGPIRCPEHPVVKSINVSSLFRHGATNRVQKNSMPGSDTQVEARFCGSIEMCLGGVPQASKVYIYSEVGNLCDTTPPPSQSAEARNVSSKLATTE